MHRFNLIIVTLLSLLPVTAAAQTDTLHRRIETLLTGSRAEVGVAVIIEGRDTVTVNNSSRYPMMSVVKLHQAMHVADWLKANGLTPDTPIHVGLEEMRPGTWSPMRDEYPDGEVSLSVGELLGYTLKQSDNNACDVLFDRTGGPLATDRYVRSLGISDFAVGVTEADMHDNPARSADNNTTPLAAAMLIERIAAMRDGDNPVFGMIWRMMTECATGASRLPRPLRGTGAVIAHKTGTGFTDAAGHPSGVNDVGFVVLPDGRHYSIAVLIKTSEEDMEATERIIADVSRIVYDYMMK